MVCSTKRRAPSGAPPLTRAAPGERPPVITGPSSGARPAPDARYRLRQSLRRAGARAVSLVAGAVRRRVASLQQRRRTRHPPPHAHPVPRSLSGERCVLFSERRRFDLVVILSRVGRARGRQASDAGSPLGWGPSNSRG